MDLVIINSAVDSLYFSYKGQAKEGFFADLEALKSQAQSREEEVPFEINGYPLVMYPYGARMFRYRMRSKDFLLFASESATLPNLKFQMLAESLYQNGHEAAFKIADDLAKEVGGMGVGKISRIDLCVDVQGWELSDDRLHDFVCRANQKGAWWDGDKPNGFQFGKGAVLARIYNKTKEIEVHNKGWMEAVWQQCPQYDRLKPVWRIEFEFKREALKEFHIDTVADAFAKLNGLWVYGVRDWLSLRSGTETRKERRPVDKDWAALPAADFPGQGCKRVKPTKGLCDAERAIAQMLGWAVSLGALWNMLLLEEVLEWAIREMEAKCDDKGVSFAQRVQKKIDQGQDQIWW